jgi:hypothetical protein
MRVGQESTALQAAAARSNHIDSINKLSTLTDAELIAGVPMRNTLSRADHEMEMQRRLRGAIGAQTAESVKARKSAMRRSADLVC